ncbi:MAG: polyphosphate kinase 2 family protein [Verrucomicrobiota bacterium]|nr:polyphosphate kinase 2 family protein [Verrucomicrobiota bacterium]
MKLRPAKFRVPPGGKWSLDAAPTETQPFYKSKAHYRELLAQQIEELTALQSLLYAHNRYALLLIFQAMDAGGKDSAIKHVMSGVDPQGCQVFSFKKPSADELDHDFLWRTTCRLPQRGHIGIFNRSYYEEVLIVRVHPGILALANLPAELVDEKTLWTQRFRSINDLEHHLHQNGTRVLKFFLHVSKDEQRKRFLARLDGPDKNWKFETGDLQERSFWDQYMHAYEECLRATSTKDAPWYAIPADDKKNARLIISSAIVETLQSLPMSYPQPSDAHRKELKSIAKLLIKEEKS